MHAPDDAFSRSVEASLGHRAPFDPAECAAFAGTLVLEGVCDLSGLAAFPALRHLEVLASEPADWAPIAGLRALESLTIVATPASSLPPLGALARLESVELSFAGVDDVAFLDDLPALRRCVVIANPLQGAARKALAGRLPTSRARRAGRAPVVHLGEGWHAENEVLAAAGFDAIFGQVGGRVFLVRPGLPLDPEHPCEALEVVPSLALDAVNGAVHPRWNDVLDACLVHVPARPDLCGGWVSAQALRTGWVFGDAEDARAWVAAASLSAADRRDLCAFVERFPDRAFARHRVDALDRLEARTGFAIPAVIRSVAEVLGGRGKLFLDGFDWPHPRADALLREPYLISLAGPSTDAESAAFEFAGWFPFARQAGGRSVLVVRVDRPGDAVVHEFDPSDVSPAGAPDPLRVRPVLRSYARLLGRCVAVG